jgi:trk system potassium uptake protein TrkA
MRAVFLGGGSLAVNTARALLKRGHEVVLIELDQKVIDMLSEELDCGFIHGDGSRPAILREADPQHSAVLYCLSNHDQTNIIASLVGRSLGFNRVVTKIEDPELEHICIELGLEDTIIPSRSIGIHLAELFEGRDPMEFSTMLRDDARVFSLVAHADDAGPMDALKLPERTRIVCLYRNGEFLVPDKDTDLRADDEVVLITHRANLETLNERFETSN